MYVLQNQISAVLEYRGIYLFIFYSQQIQQLILGYFYGISNEIVLFGILGCYITEL